ncbi:MAG TPA: ABC transporter ATP-binding protein [Dysgonomonas sp.]|nr:ABC transporter ATP-binding protein [Dysgonomonas sp.]
MIEIRDLIFHYKKSRTVFYDLSLDIGTGIYGLLGENGVGKTTLLHIISGLRFPKSGSCKVLGYDSFRRNPQMLSQLFFLPEEFDTPDVSIDNYAKLHAAFYPNFDDVQFNYNLKELKVDKDKKMNEQSLGQRKKAMIAFALALNTPILLLDEPTNGLDIPSKSQFRKLLASVYDHTKCIIISSHQVRDLENLIDPIIILDRNDIILNHSLQEISEKLLFTYTTSKPDESLYCEQALQGYSSVQINEDGKESIVNIESLFSAAVNNKVKIKNLFK